MGYIDFSKISGPDFLVIYGFLSFIIWTGVYFFKQIFENGEIGKIALNDPYLIAYLRGGYYEALRIASLSLVEKGFLNQNKNKLKKNKKKHEFNELINLEIEILNHFENEEDANSLFGNDKLIKECDIYKRKLEKDKLLITDELNSIRKIIFITVVVLLGCIPIYRIYLSVTNGKYNVFYLVLFTVLNLIFIYRYIFSKYKKHTKKLLDNLKESVKYSKTIKSRKHSASVDSGDVILMAAIMGSAYIASEMLYANELYPKTYNSNSSSSSSCGAGCSSSCGSDGGGGSCGSGCGGGCGGGD